MNEIELKTDFLREILREGVADLFNYQREIALYRKYRIGKKRRVKFKDGRWLGIRTGRLFDSLENPSYSVRDDGTEISATLGYLRYMRFLDMKSGMDLQIYNRQVWGVLYSEVFPKMRRDFRDWLAGEIGRILQESYT